MQILRLAKYRFRLNDANDCQYQHEETNVLRIQASVKYPDLGDFKTNSPVRSRRSSGELPRDVVFVRQPYVYRGTRLSLSENPGPSVVDEAVPAVHGCPVLRVGGCVINLTLTLSLVSIVINKLTVWVMLTICSNQSSLE